MHKDRNLLSWELMLKSEMRQHGRVVARRNDKRI